MTAPGRIAITVGAALALGITAYGNAWAILPSGSGQEAWGFGVLAAYLLAVVGAFVVDRSWALLPAVVPTAVGFYLYNLTSYSTPWDSESVGSPNEPVSYAVLLLLAIGIQAAVLSIGLMARRLWDGSRRQRSSKANPKEGCR